MDLKRIMNIVGVLMLAAVFAGCAEQPVAAADNCHGDGCKVGEYRIGPGDVLHISVWKDQGLDRVVTVRPDGMISFPLLDDVKASGLTPVQLQKAVSDALKQFMADPAVSVVVQEVHSFAASVLGEVKTPGRYEFKGSATVLDLLAEAGGLTPYAARSKIVILRDDGAGKQRILFDYDAALTAQGAQQPFYVHPGDIIMVP